MDGIPASTLTNRRFLQIYSKTTKSKQYCVNELASVLNCSASDIRNEVYKLKRELIKLRGAEAVCIRQAI